MELAQYLHAACYSPVQSTFIKAIKNNIAIFSLHTALDNSWNGVNAMICSKLNLTNKKILIPKKNTIKKLTTYVPAKHSQNLLSELFKAGAGTIGMIVSLLANPIFSLFSKSDSEN